MKPATAHLLTALFALAHRIALPAEEVAELDRDGTGLSPALWQATRHLLVEADQGAPGTTFDLGFTALLLRWLGFASEDAFAETFGVGVAEAIEHDRGRLDEIAGALQSPGTPGFEELAVQLTVAWTRRGIVLQARPHAAAAAVEALERAVAHYPREDARYRELLESLLLACEACGDRARQGTVDGQLQAFDRESESRGEPAVVHSAAALVLSILWCVAHDEFLLDAERGLEPSVRASPEVWAQVRACVEADDLDGIPIPIRTYVAWLVDDRVDSEGLRRCLEASAGAGLLAQMVREVERLWGGERLASSPAASHVLAAARLRRARLEHTWVPLPDQRQNVFYEAHQGARRPATLQRLELIHRIHGLFLRCSPDDRVAVASVWLDRAAECESRGEHDQERVALTRAVELMRADVRDSQVREYAEVCSASWLWRQGDWDEARGRVLRLQGAEARELLAQIEAREPQRAALRSAERLVGQGDLESSCEFALAHLRAGHSTRGEQLARDLCRVHPEEPTAWVTLARVLYEHGRYRDAVGPASRALEIRAGRAGQVLLARILSRIGPDGRAQGGAIALEVIEPPPFQAGLKREELADLVRIAEDAGAPLAACRGGDDLVLVTDGAGPPEWYGEGVARRFRGVSSPDAPAWLACLADAARSVPAELARFVVDRFEWLLYARRLVGQSLFGSVPDLEAEGALYSRARALGEGVHGLSIEPEVAAGAGRAEASLGWLQPMHGDPVERAIHWVPHLETIGRVFGRDGAVRLRASVLAQAMFFGEEEVAERERLVVLATFEAERFYWVRWVAEQESLRDLALGRYACSLGTLARLRPIFDLAADGSFAAVSSAAWATRWHELERQ